MDQVNSRTPFNPPTYLTEGELQEVGVALDIGLFPHHRLYSPGRALASS